MSQPDTIDRILDAAAALFAERGYAETSLRTITGTANVNLAAVNYHFGSKKALIQAVFARFLTPFCHRLESELDVLEKQTEGQPELDDLLKVLFSSLLTSMRELETSPDVFMRLLGSAYTQSQDHLRHFIMKEYGSYYGRFTALLRNSMPEIGPEVFYWRLYFMLGASVFTLSSYDSTSAILKADYDKDSNIDEVTGLLVSSLSQMLQGPQN